MIRISVSTGWYLSTIVQVWEPRWWIIVCKLWLLRLILMEALLKVLTVLRIGSTGPWICSAHSSCIRIIFISFGKRWGSKSAHGRKLGCITVRLHERASSFCHVVGPIVLLGGREEGTTLDSQVGVVIIYKSIISGIKRRIVCHPDVDWFRPRFVHHDRFHVWLLM